MPICGFLFHISPWWLLFAWLVGLFSWPLLSRLGRKLLERERKRQRVWNHLGNRKYERYLREKYKK